MGAAVGGASFVVPLYISELAPSPFRGRMVVVSSLFITGGQVVAYVIGWGFSEKVGGWRWMVGLGALPAAIQCVLMWWMPETPRWLVRAGKRAGAKRVLGRVYAGSEGVDERALIRGVLGKVEREILEEEGVVGGGGDGAGADGGGKTGWNAMVDNVVNKFNLLVGVGGNRRALIIACMLQGAQQLCGFVWFPLPQFSFPSHFLPSIIIFSSSPQSSTQDATATCIYTYTNKPL